MAEHIEGASCEIFIALGSNIDPVSNLVLSVELLSLEFEIIAASSVWESAPVGFVDQLPFLNAAILIRSSLSPQEIKGKLLKVESQLKRVRDPLNINGPRTIDLDISLFGDQIIAIDKLRIPDPDILTRPFLTVPLAELDFERIHPTQCLSLGEIARKIGGIKDLRLREDVLLHGSQPVDIRELKQRFN